MSRRFADYVGDFSNAALMVDENSIAALEAEIYTRIVNKKNIFICGNGGSGANAVHMENDFVYGVAKSPGGGAKIHALSANTAVISCLANDVGYSEIFSEQLRVKGSEGDLLIVLSGSGNSANILSALQVASEMGLVTAAILGFDGGAAAKMVDILIHSEINDMQVSEDIQCAVLHHIMQNIFRYISNSADRR